jgi:hypothetical protein
MQQHSGDLYNNNKTYAIKTMEFVLYRGDQKDSGQICKKLLNSMGLNTYCVANSCLSIQQLPSIVWNMKVHYSVYKSPLQVPILCKINPVHIPRSYVSNIHPNSLFTSMSKSF